MENGNFKGNLRNTNSPIIKIRVRSIEGHPLHKAEFRMNDSKSIIKEIILWKEKFGVNCINIKPEFNKILLSSKQEEINEERNALSDWREKTRGLREIDLELQKKVKESL